MLYQLECWQKRQDGCAVPRHNTTFVVYSCRWKKFAKVRVSKCRRCLMRFNKAEVAGHSCLISAHVITLCACVERWPKDEAGYTRVQMTSSCQCCWHQTSSNTTEKIEDAWKNWYASLCREKRKRFSHDKMRKIDCSINWAYWNIQSKI